jgi:hypothetical protein
VARSWLTIRVELLSGLYAECDPAPGRVFLVGPRHTFEQLARAINLGFARWDHSHLYDFELADGNVVGFPDEEFGETDMLDHATTKVLSRVRPGDRFGYRFDFGDEWIHECMVEESKVDPLDVYGQPPIEPVPIFGWGTIPDQYGRTTDGRDVEFPVEPETPFPFLHDELARIIELNDREPMTTAELADTINAEGRYRKKDGSPVTSSQISARVSMYPQLFERVDEGRIRLHRAKRG